MSLEEIGEIGVELAELPPDRVPDRRDSAALSSRWAERVDERIADLSHFAPHDASDLLLDDIRQFFRALR